MNIFFIPFQNNSL